MYSYNPIPLIYTKPWFLRECFVWTGDGKKKPWDFSSLFHVLRNDSRMSITQHEPGSMWPAEVRVSQGTLVVICAFLIIFGGTTQLMLSCLSIRTGRLAGNAGGRPWDGDFTWDLRVSFDRTSCWVPQNDKKRNLEVWRWNDSQLRFFQGCQGQAQAINQGNHMWPSWWCDPNCKDCRGLHCGAEKGPFSSMGGPFSSMAQRSMISC